MTDGALSQRAAEEERMPIFITHGRYTRNAIRGMIVKPEDRADAVSRPLTKSGGRLIGSCLTFGEYDFLTSVEALSFRSAGGT